MGGYWLIDVKSREEAIAWASRCPGSDNEVIEVRRVQELSEFPAEVQDVTATFLERQRTAEQRRRE